MGARGVRKTIWTPEIVRSRIRTSQIARRLTDHVLGQVEMSATQVTAALGLLRKTLPDLSQMDLKTARQDIADINTDELVRRISALEGALGPQASGNESSEVH